jgi:ribose transport system permease protein
MTTMAGGLGTARSQISRLGAGGLLVVVLVATVAIFSYVLQGTTFLSTDNFLNIVRQTTMVSVMAVGTVFVLSAGEIDLSFGATIALSALVGGLVINAYGPIPGIAAALVTGGLVGAVNGAVVTRLGIPSFIVTLGMLGVVTGLGQWITNLASVPVQNPAFTYLFGSGAIGPIPLLLLWTVGVAIVGHVVLRRTPYGRYVLSAGGNEVAARFSGIKTARIKASVLIVSGVTAALVGLLYTGWLQGARYTLGTSDLITVLAAVIIGGTALNGGRGTVFGAVMGSLLMGTINNGLVLLGLTIAQQEIFRGLIIVVAVALSGQRPKLR